jgi:type IV pilus assembly protein PilE
MKNPQRGITLLELMIVVAVVGILAAIAYPSYRQQVIRSNRTDAKVALEQTAQALEKCFTRYMSYANFAACQAANQFQAGGGFDSANGRYRITGAITIANPQQFALTATPLGGQVADTQCANFTLNERGTRGVSGPGPATSCW